jgi:hypothetical protein
MTAGRPPSLGSGRRGRLVRHFAAAAASLLAVAGCASGPQPVRIDPYLLEQSRVAAIDRRSPELPNAAILRAAFLRQILHLCDELTCSYYPPRLFRVRGLSCRPRPQDPGRNARCIYWRQLVRRDGSLGRWRRAETDLSHAEPEGGWVVTFDWRD